MVVMNVLINHHVYRVMPFAQQVPDPMVLETIFLIDSFKNSCIHLILTTVQAKQTQLFWCLRLELKSLKSMTFKEISQIPMLDSGTANGNSPLLNHWFKKLSAQQQKLIEMLKTDI